MKLRAVFIGAVAVAVALALALCLPWPGLLARHGPGARVMVSGGDAGGLPRVQPQEAHIDASALERAGRDAAADGLQALVIMRHGYIVFERYGHGMHADSMIDSGAFAQVLLALLTGIAAHDNSLPLLTLNGFDPSRLRTAIEAGTHQSYPDYLSLHLWRRLNAAPAWIALPDAGAATGDGASAPADCCFHARLLDWLRVACVLLDDGHFEGKSVVPAGWVARMRRPVSASGADGFGVELASAAHGAEPFASDDVFFVRGPGRWRLWLMPTLDLGVLFGSQSDIAAGWDETRLANLVIRAVAERPEQRSAGSQLQQLVPGH
jgi:hypothetical protein